MGEDLKSSQDVNLHTKVSPPKGLIVNAKRGRDDIFNRNIANHGQKSAFPLPMPWQFKFFVLFLKYRGLVPMDQVVMDSKNSEEL